MSLIDDSKEVVIRAQHAECTIHFHMARDVSHWQGDALPSGTQTVILSASDETWYVFWYAGKHLLLRECDLATISVAAVRKALIALAAASATPNVEQGSSE